MALPLRRQSSTLARGRQQKVCRRPTLLRLPLSARVSLQEPTTVKFRRWSVSRPRIAPPTGRASHSPVVVGQTSRVTQAATKIPRSVILPPYHLLVPIHLVPDHLSQAEAPSTRKTILPPRPSRLLLLPHPMCRQNPVQSTVAGTPSEDTRLYREVAAYRRPARANIPPSWAFYQ